jgi:ribulose-5-phosphate 4-epimerase/fuculose-1-phosphate aldolase
MAVAQRTADRSVRDQVSAEEWQVRLDLAAVYRLVAHFGWDDLVFTHASARVPGEDGTFLINPFGLLFDEITASSLVKVDREGNTVLASEYEANAAGFVIHGGVLEARPDVNCVVHLHTDYGQAVSAQAQGLLPLTQTAMFLDGDIGYHDFEGTATDLDERDRLGADLGDKNCLILRNHGTLTVGKHASDAFARIYFLERACKTQILAQSGAADLTIPAQDSIARSAAVAQKGMDDGYAKSLAWPALIRRMDRIDPGYRD